MRLAGNTGKYTPSHVRYGLTLSQSGRTWSGTLLHRLLNATAVFWPPRSWETPTSGPIDTSSHSKAGSTSRRTCQLIYSYSQRSAPTTRYAEYTLTLLPLQRWVQVLPATSDLIALVIALYDTTVTDPDQVLHCINWTLRPPHLTKSSPAAYGFVCFQRCFMRYLRGVGHPDHPMVHALPEVTPDIFVAERQNKTLRAELFLQALTDCRSLPSLLDGKLKVRNVMSRNENYLPLIRLSSSQRALSPTPTLSQYVHDNHSCEQL